HGWLTDISHLSEGHRVAVHYGYDDKGRLTGERQTVENPETGELLWQHETTHAYNEQGLANRVTPDSLPPVEWLTYGSGYLAGMKLGDTPLLEYTRDRMHRETVRSFGSMAGSNAAYKLTSTYTPAGQLQSQHLNSLVYDRDYGWNDNGDLVRISGPRQTREYGYSATGRLEEEIRADRVSSESRAWLAQCGLTVEQLARQVEPEYTPARKVHFYHCDHRGLPLALISEDGNTAWRGEYDEWGNQLNEENPYYLHQPYRLPGQQHDEESGLYYNRNRYYDPLQGRYITQDPIGLAGGWNLYNYPLNPIIRMDPLGLYNLYQLLYDVWHDDSYGTSSIDITGSGDLISLGGHAGLGVAFAKKKGEMLSDICIYATACGHAGIGGGINAAITYSETKSLPTSGVSNSVGVTVGGGVGGHFAYTYVVDVDNPESSTESVGIGAGVDASVMTLACRTWQECWVN
ncbi:TPA: RHS repeat protein, partial [Escherichia coli]|nr:RHS repeat protein [Escherichia coli]ELR3427409.1 RHS repeat protein [Escherichia coli]ELR3438853.1 RHS repeat protein [Escherichia coli]ELW7892704.1 RHS repeat protein [Escherichia coli]HEB0440297.1 RHS repeat protein [Escherichia coli]